MDAIKFLIREHNKIRKTLATISNKAKETTKQKMFKLLAEDLVRHEKMEQTVWYPYLKKHLKLKTKIKHLLHEEKKAATNIKKIKTIKTDEKWEKMFTSLKKDVSHHANEEETKLFPKVKKLLEKEELSTLGKKLSSFKNKFNNHYLK